MVHDMQWGQKGSNRKIGRRLVDHLVVLFPFAIICIHSHLYFHHLHSFTFIHIICIIKNQCANCKRIGLRYLRCKKIHLSVMEVLIHCDPSQWNSSVPTHNGNNCMADASGPQPHMISHGTWRDTQERGHNGRLWTCS